MRITENKVVTIEYRMLDREGRLVDTSDGGEPLSFIQGRATLFPAVEAQVEGCKSGERRTFTLEPDQAYGERSEALICEIPREKFVGSESLKPGMTFTGTTRGHRHPVKILQVNKDSVTVDANHPLAGEKLDIDLVILEVREAVEAELATGVVQEMADIYARENAARVDGVRVEGPALS